MRETERTLGEIAILGRSIPDFTKLTSEILMKMSRVKVQNLRNILRA